VCTLLAHVNTESSGHLLSVILLPHSASPFSYEDRCSHVNCWLPIRQRFIYKLSALTYKALHTGQPCYLGDLIDSYEPSRCLRSTNCHLLAVPSCVKSSFASRAFVYLRLIIGILSLRTFAHLTVLSLSNPTLNLTFSLLPITSSHPHASASDSSFDYWRYIKKI